MTKALELAKFGRESPPAGAVVGDSDTQTLSSKTFSDGPVFSGLNANGVPFLNASKVLGSSGTFVFDGTNLGIGVASPAYKFDVQGSGAGIGVARFASNDTNTTTALAIFQRNGGAVSASVKYNATNSPLTIDFGTTTSHALTFITADTERMRIASGGNVGVGTADPALKLDVNGSIKMSGGTGTALTWDTAIGSQYLKYDNTLDGLILAGYGGLGFRVAGSATNAVTVSSTGNVGIGAAPTAVTGFGINKFLEIGGASVPGLVLRPTGSTSEHSVLGAGDGLLIGAAGAATATNNVIRFFTSNVNSSNASLGERLRIESNGTIKKLGTNGGLLLMDGNTAGGVKIGSYTSNFLGDGYLAFEGYSIEYGRFDSAGNFMVGVTSTSAIANRNIDVNGTGDASFNIRVGGTTRAYFYSTAGQTLLGTNTNIPITFYPNNIERMKIATDGAVTIGNAIAATNVVLNFNGVANKAKRLVFQDSGVDQWIMGSGAASENDAFEIYNANGQMALSFAKASSNATFVGSVTTSRLNVTNNSAYAIEVYGTGLVQDAPSGNNDHIATARVRIGYMRSTNIGTIASNGGDSGLSLITHSTSTGWKESVRIQPDGNVGIGTTSPSKPLQIKTTASAAGTYYLATIGGSNYLSGYAVGLGFDPEGYGYRNKIAIIAEGNNQGYSRGKLHIAFNALNNSTEASISDSKVTFLENGFVGIGLDGGDPEAKLHVKMFRSSSTSGIALLLADNVIGGQTNNVYKAIRSASNSGSSVSEIRFVETDGTNNNTAIAFATAHTAGGLSEKARVGPDGQFMVGTTVGNAGGGGIHATGPILQGAAGLYQQQISISGGNTIQSLNLGVGYYPLYLQPLGSNVIVGTTSTALLGIGTFSYNSNSTSNPTLLVRNGGGSAAFVTFSDSGVDTTIYGSITRSGSNTVYNTSSDYRLKNITGALTGYKQRLMALQPKQGTWISDSSEFRGFLAHEFANHYPKSVTGEKDAVDANGNPVTQGMQASSSEVMADLIAMVQDLITENESLKARLSAANL